MKKRIALALSSLAAGWLALPAFADTPVVRLAPGADSPAIVQGTVEGTTVSAPTPGPAPSAIPGPAPHGPAPLPHGAPILSGVGDFHGQCASCNDCPTCEDENGGGGPVGGIGFYYLKPHFETNAAYAASATVPGTPGGIRFVRQEDFKYDYDWVPVIWLGYVNEANFGARLRHWRLDFSAGTVGGNDGQTSIDSAAPLGLQNLSTTLGDLLAFETDLNIQVWDAEAIQGIRTENWDILFAGGVRYVHYSQSYNHWELPDETGGSNTLIDGGTSGHQLKGWGPTVAVEVRRLCGDMGLAVYGSARGSLVFGDAKQTSYQVTNSLPTTIASTERQDLIPITEYEIGVEGGTSMGGTRVFAQAALVGQVWYGAGNGANNELIPVLVDPEVSDNSSNFGLFGFKFVIGINY